MARLHRFPSRLPWLLLAGLLCAAPLSARAAGLTLTGADRVAIRSVIQRQLDAFRRDDAAAAFALASPGIRARFGSAARFLAMVREDYQAVYRPRHVTFLNATVSEGQVQQEVLLLGPDDLQVLAIYPMVHNRDGSWATDGCELVDLPSKSA